MRDGARDVQSRGGLGCGRAPSPPERMPGWHTTSRRPTRTNPRTRPRSTRTSPAGRRRQRPHRPGTTPPPSASSRPSSGARRMPACCPTRSSPVRAPARSRTPGARSLERRPSGDHRAARRLCRRPGRRLRRRRPVPGPRRGRRPASCSCSACTPTPAARATARACSTRASTRLAAAAELALTAWVLADDERHPRLPRGRRARPRRRPPRAGRLAGRPTRPREVRLSAGRPSTRRTGRGREDTRAGVQPGADRPQTRGVPGAAVVRQGLSVGIATGAYGVSFGALAVAAGLDIGRRWPCPC